MITVLIVIAVLVILVAAAFLAFRFKPELMAPLTRRMMKSRRVRENVSGRVSKQIAENPEALDGILDGQMGREETRQFQKMVKGKSEDDIKKMMSTVMDKQQSGEEITIADVQGKTKTPEQLRAKNKKKRADRAKRKQARSQRKRNRR